MTRLVSDDELLWCIITWRVVTKWWVTVMSCQMMSYQVMMRSLESPESKLTQSDSIWCNAADLVLNQTRYWGSDRLKVVCCITMILPLQWYHILTWGTVQDTTNVCCMLWTLQDTTNVCCMLWIGTLCCMLWIGTFSSRTFVFESRGCCRGSTRQRVIWLESNLE